MSHSGSYVKSSAVPAGDLTLQARNFLCRVLLLIILVILSHRLEWAWLRFITSEAVLRISPYLGMATNRASFDTILVQGHRWRIVIACTYVDVFMGAIPLVWNLEKSVLRNCSTLVTAALGLFVVNLLRLEIGQLLYTRGAPRILVDDILSGLTYFAIWIAIVTWFRGNWGKFCLI